MTRPFASARKVALDCQRLPGSLRVEAVSVTSERGRRPETEMFTGWSTRTSCGVTERTTREVDAPTPAARPRPQAPSTPTATARTSQRGVADLTEGANICRARQGPQARVPNCAPWHGDARRNGASGSRGSAERGCCSSSSWSGSCTTGRSRPGRRHGPSSDAARPTCALQAERTRLERRLVLAQSVETLGREARRLGYVKPGERLFIVKGILQWQRRHARRASADR